MQISCVSRNIKYSASSFTNMLFWNGPPPTGTQRPWGIPLYWQCCKVCKQEVLIVHSLPRWLSPPAERMLVCHITAQRLHPLCLRDASSWSPFIFPSEGDTARSPLLSSATPYLCRLVLELCEVAWSPLPGRLKFRSGLSLNLKKKKRLSIVWQ